MAQMLLPADVYRSPTAAPGLDFRDDYVYSAGVVAHGATGQLTLFTVPKGQAIPEIMSSSLTATTNDWQKTYSDLTTNLAQAGQLGEGIGNVAVRSIAIDIEECYEGQTTAGADERTVKEILRKMIFYFKLGSKEMTKGPVRLYGAAGGIHGAIATTNTDTTVHLLNNGMGPRRLKTPIPISKIDLLECDLVVQGATGLSFTTQTGLGGPTLIWVTLFCNVGGAVR